LNGISNWGVGDWATFNGTAWQRVEGGAAGNFTDLTASGTVTLSAGEANGVAFLNGSKVLSSSSFFTYDDSTGISLLRALNQSGNTSFTGTTSIGSSSGTSTANPFFQFQGRNDWPFPQILRFQADYVSGAASGMGLTISSRVSDGTFQNRYRLLADGTAHIWSLGATGTEGMRLTSSLLSVVPGATIQGLTVGRGAGAVSTNTAVGASALAGNTSGASNAAFAQGALQLNTTGSANTALGLASVQFNTTGSNNTGVGYQALNSNTTASNNTAVGYQAGFSNVTGSVNVFVGGFAGYGTTTGLANTMLGYRAGYTNSTGQITALGYAALENSTTASSNTGVGVAALRQNTSGSGNTAVGDSSLQLNTTASNNTAVGYLAGYSNTTGTSNSLFGHIAGYTNQTGSSNTIIGKDAGSSLTTSSNTLIGAGAGSDISSGSKNTILGRYTGNQGGLDIRTASNYIVLSDGDGNPRGIFDGSGNFTAPSAAIRSTSGTTASLGSGGTATILQPDNLTHWMLTANGDGNTTQFAQVMVYVNSIGGVTVTSLVSVGIAISASGANTVIVTNGATTQTVGYAAIRIK
jgi:hypothetical protein